MIFYFVEDRKPLLLPLSTIPLSYYLFIFLYRVPSWTKNKHKKRLFSLSILCAWHDNKENKNYKALNSKYKMSTQTSIIKWQSIKKTTTNIINIIESKYSIYYIGKLQNRKSQDSFIRSNINLSSDDTGTCSDRSSCS